MEREGRTIVPEQFQVAVDAMTESVESAESGKRRREKHAENTIFIVVIEYWKSSRTCHLRDASIPPEWRRCGSTFFDDW
jgi:hypothetical protein